jgi:hypothetical protein
MSDDRKYPLCRQCGKGISEVIRIAPVDHDPGMIVYECLNCGSVESFPLARETPPQRGEADIPKPPDPSAPKPAVVRKII